MSLDVFRGATIAAMLLVNNAGDWGHVFEPLEHAKWHGCTATDLVFPFFLFIMGVAMNYSFAKRKETGASPAGLLAGVARRSAMLIGLGLLLNFEASYALPWSEHFRPMGVLQRIGLCYLAASVIVLWGSARAQVAWFCALLAGYCLLMKYVPVPGHGAGILTQQANLASWLDTRLLGVHTYEFDAATGLGHDPEGLLSTLPAIATTLSGCLAGLWLRTKDKTGYEKVAGMCVAGSLLVVAGKWWNYSFPMNKNLWTSSYVLFTSGWALLGLGACYWAIDLKQSRAWTRPFVVYGSNAIVAYVGASAMAYATIWIRWTGPDGKPLFLKSWAYAHLVKPSVAPLLGEHISSAAYGFSYVIVWLAVLWVMYRKRIFLKV